jgi:hypothetical protein
MKRMGLMFVIIIFLSCMSVYADVSIKQYVEYRKSGDQDKVKLIKVYVGALGEGFSWTNVVLVDKKLPPLYCEPPDLKMTWDRYMAILDKYLEEPFGKSLLSKDKGTVPAVLLFALEDAFPCTK